MAELWRVPLRTEQVRRALGPCLRSQDGHEQGFQPQALGRGTIRAVALGAEPHGREASFQLYPGPVT